MNSIRIGPHGERTPPNNNIPMPVAGEETTAAVLIRDACKWYGKQNSSSCKLVLNHLDMTVPRGVIYGLLGASGCGKTTLLSSIVGRRNLNSGKIWVLGGKPGAPGSGVPGPRIGYMPQEIAMINEFTVKDAVYFFGRIYGMSTEKLAERFRFLSKLLELPPDDRMLGNCSGGQQRRVSFAAALVHEPELLILDEPTVGLDPVLREIIWDYLIQLTVERNTAVIITTHYIEETKQAHLIGLMRGGELMAEETPTDLCTILRCDSLEQAFYELSVKQTRGECVPEFQNDEYIRNKHERTQKLLDMNASRTDLTNASTTDSTCVLTEGYDKEKLAQKGRNPINVYVMKALFVKTIIQFFRHPGTLAFNILFPILQITIFYLAIGHDPKYLKIGISNNEIDPRLCPNVSKYRTVTFYESNETCKFNTLSCTFLNLLDETIISKVYYDNLHEALEAVRTGETWGAIHMAENFSEAFLVRKEDGRFTEEQDLEASEIQVYLDESDFQIKHFLMKKLRSKFKIFAEFIFEECKENRKLASIPINFNDPVYGYNDDSYTSFVTPGITLTIVFFLAVTITSSTIIADRSEGIWDRSIVAGVKTTEMMISHLVTQFTIVTAQVFIVIFICLVIFNMRVNGNMITLIALILLQGFSGMCLGFLVSNICTTYFQANFASTGIFYPLLLLCGTIWPIEGMPYALKLLSQISPLTYPVSSMRNILSKGWSINNWSVLNGFVVTLIWSFIFILMSFVLLRRKM